MSAVRSGPAALEGHKTGHSRWSMSLAYNRGRCGDGVPPSVEMEARTLTVEGTFNPARRDVQCLRGAFEAGAFDYICLGGSAIPSYAAIKFRDAGAAGFLGGGHLVLAYHVRDVGRPI